MSDTKQMPRFPNIHDMPDSAQSWVEFAKFQKAWAVEKLERGDITPTVIIERDGHVQAIVVSPQVDKYLGLQAAAMCQAGYDPDSITMVMDAHIGMMTPEREEGAPPMTEEDIEKATQEFRKKYPKGMQHACDNEDACATGDITDCLICHRINRKGEISMAMIPYAYHGKDGPPLKWLDQEPKYKKMFEGSTDGPDGLVLKGLIPDALRKIMTTPPILEAIRVLKKFQESSDFTPERIRFHIARALMAMMASKNFMILDFLSGQHPEWTGAKDQANEILAKMQESGFVPKEAFESMKKVIDDHMGTKDFVPTMTKLLKANGYWLPAEPREDIERFVLEFESFCMSPQMPDGIGEESDDSEAPPTASARHGQGKRVRVWNGDRSEYLGEGQYVGNTSVFIIQMEDGSLRSNTDAETEPVDIPEGGVVRKINNNPKIVLDNGQTVYGCQVWWEPVDEAPDGPAASTASPHQHHAGCKHNDA